MNRTSTKKLGKKLLSSLLSLLIVLSSLMAGLSVTAAAALDAANVKTKVDAAASRINGVSSGSNAWTYSNDDGTVLAAAEAVWDYLIELRGDEDRLTEASSNNATDTLKSTIQTNTGANANALLRLINPNGTAVYGYENKQQKTGSYKGTALINPDPGWDPSKCSYNTNVSDSVTKTITVQVDLANLLATCATVDDIPEEILKSCVYTYVHTNGKTAEQTGRSKNWAGVYTYNWKTYKWNYIDVGGCTRTETAETRDVKGDFQNYIQYFLAADVNRDLETLIATYNAAELQGLHDSVLAAYNDLVSKNYPAAALSHFSMASASQIATYISNLEKARKINLVMPGIETLLQYVGQPYDNTDIDQMNALNASVVAAYDSVQELGDDPDVLAYLQTKGEPYTSFDLATCTAYVNQLRLDIAMCFLRQAKAVVDSDIVTYTPLVSDKMNEDDITNLELSALADRVQSCLNQYAAANAAYPDETAVVFPDGIGYVSDFRALIQEKQDVRGVQSQRISYYTQLMPYITADLSLWNNAALMTRYTEDSETNAEIAQSITDAGASVGAEVAQRAFTMLYDGEDLLLTEIVSRYLDRLRVQMIARNQAQLAKAMSYGDVNITVSLDNYMGIKGAIGQFDTDLYNYCLEKGWVTDEEQATYADTSVLLSKYNAFIATGGLNGFTQVHNKDANGVFTTRYAGLQTVDGALVGYANDLARNGEGDNYKVTDTLLEQVIDKLDAFLTSNEISYLMANFDEPLKDFLMRTLADRLFTDDMVNTLIGALYPAIDDGFDEMVWPEIDNISGVTPKSHEEITNLLGIGIYPKQVAAQINGELFPYAASRLRRAGLDWDSEYLYDEEGNFKLVWGVSDMVSDDFPTVQEYYTAKLTTFKSALSQGLKALENFLVPLFGENSYVHTGEDVATALIISVDLKLTINGLPGYSILVAPILEALNLTPLTQQEAKSQLTSTDAIVNAFLDPICSFATGKLSNQPIRTLLEVLPNLLYGLSFDRISSLMNLLQMNIHYDPKIIGGLITVKSGDVDLNIGDLFKINELVKHDNPDGSQTVVPLDDVNALINHLVGSLLTEDGSYLSLPVINGGRLIRSASVNTNASTRRAAVCGNRIQFTPDLAEELYVVLDWLTRALGDSDFVQEIMLLLTGNAPNDEVKAIISNIAADNNATLAGLVELIKPQAYGFMDYDWVQSPYTYGEIEGLTDADIAYLAYRNSWTKDKAQYTVDHIDEILQSALATEEDNATLNEKLQAAISGLFNNDGISSLVKTFVSLGNALDNERLYEILARETGVDLRVWYNAFGYLFEAEGALLPTDEGYENNTGVTGTPSGESITWALNGTALADADRAAWLDVFCAVCAPLAPIVKLILTGEDLPMLGNLITVKGYDTYKNSIAVLFEALDIDAMNADEYATYCVNHGAVEAFNTLAKQLSDWIDDLLRGNSIEKILGLLPNVVYFLESNGLAAALHNLLMPLLVVVDTIRPAINIDLNSILSAILTTLLNGRELESGAVLSMLFGGGTSVLEEGDKDYQIDVNDLRLSKILELLDVYFGTKLANSPLAAYTIPALCAGRQAYTSASGQTAYNTTIDSADALTILLSGLVESLEAPANDGKTNGEILIASLDEMIEDVDLATLYGQIETVLHSEVTDLGQIDWAYMIDGPVTLDNTFTLPEQTAAIADSYLSYSTNWNNDLATYVDENLDEIAAAILEAAGQEEGYLATLVQGLLNDQLYTDDMINMLVGLIAKLFASLDATLLDLVDCLLDTNIASWFPYCEIEYDEDGAVSNVVCTKEWGVTDRESFIDAFKTAAAPALNLIDFLCFGKSYSFLTGTEKDAAGNFTYNDLITLQGNEGYNYAFVPVMEALGCDPLPASAFLVDGAYDVNLAIEGFLGAIADRLEEIAANPLKEILDILPNVIYFLNANGLMVCLNNLVAPLETLIGAFNPDAEFGLLGAYNDEIPISELTTENLLAIIEGTVHDSLQAKLDVAAQETGAAAQEAPYLFLSDEVKAIISTFYIGDTEYFTSANGQPAFRIHYSEKGDRKDMITILVSLLLEVLKMPENEQALSMLMDENVYQVIFNILHLHEADMRRIQWQNTQYADTETTFSGMNTSKLFNGGYGKLYTKEMATYIAENIDSFVDDMIQLLGIQIDGKFIVSLSELLENFVGESIYTTENLQKIYAALSDAIARIEDIKGAKHLKKALKTSLNVDLDAYDGYEVASIEEGSRDAFAAEICSMLRPLYPLLRWLLTNEDISFFVDQQNHDLITLLGSEGYLYGAIPVMEALFCEDIPTQASYNAAVAENGDALITGILDPLFNRLDEILAEPATGIMELLPNIAYFVNSKGLDTCFKNLINAVYTLLDALEPLTGKIDVYDVIGFRIDEVNFNTIADLLLQKIAELTGEELDPLLIDGFAELTTGKLESFDSMTGEKAYRMVHNGMDSAADMITIVERLALRWLVTGENAEKVKRIIKNNVKLSSDGYRYLDALIDLCVEYCGTDLGMESILHSIYYIFYGLQHGAAATSDWLTDYNAKVQLVKESLGSSRDTALVNVGLFLDILYKRFVDSNGTTGNVFSEDGLAANGFLALFRQIIEWIRGIFAKVKLLFHR